MLALNKNEMKELDRIAVEEYSIPSIVLMEHAAKNSLDYILSNHGDKKRVLIISGTGNNGADALCLARMLKHKNFRPTVFLIGTREKLTEEGKIHFKALEALKIPIEYLDSKRQRDFLEKLDAEIDAAHLIIDAIFGISLNRKVEGLHKLVIERINESNTFVLSLDMPSGIDADNGKVLGVAVKADATMSFAHAKLGLYLNQGPRYAGKIMVADIHIPKEAEQKLVKPVKILNETVFKGLPKRDPFGHKGNFGKVLLIAGSETMGGAPALCAKAAYRSGAGLVYVLSHENNRSSILSYVPEAVVYSYSEKSDEKDLEESLLKLAKNVDSVLIGCGLSKSSQAKTFVKLSIHLDKDLVIDADGLNILAEDRSLLNELKNRKNITLLTPHLAEMSRLANLDLKDIQNDSLAIAKNFVREYNSVICLKNAHSLLCFENGHCYINVGGNSGMATAGSGDVLAGIFAANLAVSKNREDCEKLLCKAVYSHLQGGRKAGKAGSEERLIAGDIIDCL